MDKLRNLYIVGLALVGFLLWTAWQKDYHSAPPAPIVTKTQVTQSESTTLPDLPQSKSTSLSSAASLEGKELNEQASDIHVKTDVMNLNISTQGGDIRQVGLLKYPVTYKQPNKPETLLDDSAKEFFVFQSGLLSKEKMPTHGSLYQATEHDYVLADGQNELKIPLVWQGKNGVKVIKTYTLKRDSYVITVDYKVVNTGSSAIEAYPYAQFNRDKQNKAGGNHFVHTYTGAVFSSKQDDYQKVSFDDLDKKKFDQSSSTGWVAFLQHYFVAAIIPKQGEPLSFYGNALANEHYMAGVRLPAVNVAAGQTGDASYQVYLGPKKKDRLDKAAKNLQLTIDYGFLTILSTPLFWVLNEVHKLLGNWGWSIVLLTILIKLALFPLSAASYRSMAGMRKLAPKLTSLKERYGDDKQKLNQAMMALYKTEKINPLGGCLPMIVQMPVFFAYYWVLVESVELRQAPFVLWIHDLTAMDPYYVLPVLFGISMFLQQRLNPTPQDPTQAMVMKVFPLVFAVFFAFFPSGLVLYWLSSNVFSIAQQWYITRKMGAL